MEIPFLAKDRFHLHLSILKAIVLGVVALAFLGGSACTRVYVSVRVPSDTSSLTGLNCKLKRDLRNENQRTDFWCWAAAAHSVIEYFTQTSVRQCELVEAALRNRSKSREEGENPSATPESASRPCCMAEDDPASLADPPCAANGLSEDVFDTPEFKMGYFPITHEWTSFEPQGLGWDDIVTEICEDRPIVSAIAYTGEAQGGHARVIGGYKELDDGSQWVQVYDPGYSTKVGESYVMSYDAYLGIPGVFANARTYTGISLQH